MRPAGSGALSSGCRFDSRDDLVDDLMQKRFILCFGHDPDQRLGSRVADQNTARTAQPRLDTRNDRTHRGHSQRIGAGIAILIVIGGLALAWKYKMI